MIIYANILALPEKGSLQFFRSHYENNSYPCASRISTKMKIFTRNRESRRCNSKFWENRMEQIRNFEKHISQNGTIVIKFYLHMRAKEQRQRLLSK
jgi:polyphosphate kinase 2 (PPK2 family)